jgi:hypothetical protein
MFRWGVENELVAGLVLQDLDAVQRLQRGRSEAKETEPVEPVARAVVEATLSYSYKRPAASSVAPSSSNGVLQRSSRIRIADLMERRSS